jgi:two-component system invasion response regulator UvrY
VDDHNIVRTGIRRLLEDAPGIRVVGECESGEEAINLVRKSQIDVVLMDIKMPGIGGLEATRKMLRYDPDLKILILTSYTDDPFPTRLLQAGASGYITKGCDPQEMIHAIKAVKSGQRYINPNIAQQLALKHLDEKDGSPLDALSERELQVMLMITQGVKVPEIADALHLSTKTINTYRYRIFEKLKVNTDVELTRFAMSKGLLEIISDENDANP